MAVAAGVELAAEAVADVAVEKPVTQSPAAATTTAARRGRARARVADMRDSSGTPAR
jgi:hypothetical protein